jgi:hypothetical protein
VPIVLKFGSLNLLEPSGPVKACIGIALPVTLFFFLSIPAEDLVLVAVSNSYVSDEFTILKLSKLYGFLLYYATQKEEVTLYSELPQVRNYSVIRNADLYLFCSIVLTSIIVLMALSQRRTEEFMLCLYKQCELTDFKIGSIINLITSFAATLLN